LKSRGFLFLFLFFSLFVSCAQTHNSSAFYKGLLIRAEQSDETGRQNIDAAAHFENALSSTNIYVRQAAAEELAVLMLFEGMELSAITMERVRREIAGYWAAAFDAVENGPDKKKVLSFLLDNEQETASFEKARLFVLGECEKQEGFFTEREYAAIQGHFEISHYRYADAMEFFRAFQEVNLRPVDLSEDQEENPVEVQEGNLRLTTPEWSGSVEVQEDKKWPEYMPEIFFEHPVLINDLGRAFQFTSSGNEGLELFLRWESQSRVNVEGAPFNQNLRDDADDLRYRLLFYAARIARRRGDIRAVSLFEQAQPLAAEEEQEDACFWYILDLTLSRPIDVFIERLERYVRQWNDPGYFDDIMDIILSQLVSNRDWVRIIRIYSVIRDRGGAVSKAAYACVIARAIEEGYLSEDLKSLAAQAANVAEATSAVFLQIAYEANDTSLYYRSQSAAALERPLFNFPENAPTAGRGKPSPALEFILGFFNNNAAALSGRYIAAVEKELTPDELRVVAQSLAQADMHYQSMRLVAQYINTEGYTPLKSDFELWFPRPFRELVEKYAEENDIAPAILYGLIRTESAFQSGVVSRAGAVGLTQLMPDTAQEMAERIRRAGGPDYAAGEDGLDLKDPEQNIHIGSHYLNYLNTRFEDILLSLLSYNGGMNRIRRLRSASTMPVDLFMETISITETRNYGRKVMAAAAVYEDLYYRQNR